MKTYRYFVWDRIDGPEENGKVVYSTNHLNAAHRYCKDHLTEPEGDERENTIYVLDLKEPGEPAQIKIKLGYKWEDF